MEKYPEPFALEGRVALVTGGGSGLGQAIACGFAQAGVRVAVADLCPEAAEDTVRLIQQAGGEAIAHPLDVRARAEIEAVVASILQTWSHLDILVNSAAIAIGATALEYPESDWDNIIATNLKGAFLCCQIVGRHMAERRSGKIINLGSIGCLIAYPLSVAYLAAKGGVAQLTKAFAVELAPHNVQVNALAPSVFATPLLKKVQAVPGRLEYFLERTPLGRVGQPEEIVGAAIFLASDASRMVTGHILAVDGGYLAA